MSLHDENSPGDGEKIARYLAFDMQHSVLRVCRGGN